MIRLSFGAEMREKFFEGTLYGSLGASILSIVYGGYNLLSREGFEPDLPYANVALIGGVGLLGASGLAAAGSALRLIREDENRESLWQTSQRRGPNDSTSHK